MSVLSQLNGAVGCRWLGGSRGPGWNAGKATGLSLRKHERVRRELSDFGSHRLTEVYPTWGYTGTGLALTWLSQQGVTWLLKQDG